MSNRKKLRTPQHVAAADQAFAYVRELAAQEPTTGFCVLDYAAADRQCTWCDCPLEASSPHLDEDYVCGGCPKAATLDVHFLVGTPEHSLIPTCAGHLAGIQQFLLDLVPAGSSSLIQYPPA